MSITSSMYTGVTGLATYSSQMSVVSNNLANVNTVGYKNSRSQFADLLSSREGGLLIGRGVRMESARPLFSQGVYQATGGVSDLAIQGKGMFIVKNADGQSLYTRAGQFSLDKTGLMVAPEGQSVQGFPVDSTGQTVGGLQNIDLGNSLSLLPKPTAKMALKLNLQPEKAPPTNNWKDTNSVGAVGTTDTYDNWASGSSKNDQFPVHVFDSLGQSHDLTVFVRKDAATGAWRYVVTAPVKDVQANPTNPDELISVGNGTLQFKPDGTLDLGVSGIAGISVTGLVNGAADVTIAAKDLSFAGSTSVDTASNLSSSQVDGSAPGTLTGFTIDTQGVITGQYSNGGSLSLYQVALADFAGVEQLTPSGGTLWAQSPQSGDALIGTPGSGGFGTTLAGGLEQSTVDVAQEFVSMISAQRGFQANSRIITVADQMYDEVVQLKR